MVLLLSPKCKILKLWRSPLVKRMRASGCSGAEQRPFAWQKRVLFGPAAEVVLFFIFTVWATTIFPWMLFSLWQRKSWPVKTLLSCVSGSNAWGLLQKQRCCLFRCWVFKWTLFYSLVVGESKSPKFNINPFCFPFETRFEFIILWTFSFQFFNRSFHAWSVSWFAGCNICYDITEFKLAFKLCNLSTRKFFAN